MSFTVSNQGALVTGKSLNVWAVYYISGSELNLASELDAFRPYFLCTSASSTRSVLYPITTSVVAKSQPFFGPPSDFLVLRANEFVWTEVIELADELLCEVTESVLIFNAIDRQSDPVPNLDNLTALNALCNGTFTVVISGIPDGSTCANTVGDIIGVGSSNAASFTALRLDTDYTSITPFGLAKLATAPVLQGGVYTASIKLLPTTSSQPISKINSQVSNNDLLYNDLVFAGGVYKSCLQLYNDSNKPQGAVILGRVVSSVDSAIKYLVPNTPFITT